VPERERISGADPGVRKVVHDSDRSEGARIVELSHSSEVKEGVADGRPEAASDRAGDPPEDARERCPTDEKPKSRDYITPLERGRGVPKREGKCCERDAGEKPEGQPERSANGESNGEGEKDHHQTPRKRRRERDSDRPGGAKRPHDEGAGQNKDAG